MKPVGLFAAALLAALALGGCSSPLPHWIWPQKDLAPADYNDPLAPQRLLVAARRSDFKAEVVNRLVADLRRDQVYVRLIGVNQLGRAPANQFQAILIVSTCMARTLDPKVSAFLAGVRDKSRVILLTTSSRGGCLPGPDRGPYDAISSASRMNDAPVVAAEAAAAVRRLLAAQAPAALTAN